MILWFLITFYALNDSVITSFNEHIRLGNYSVAHSIAKKALKKQENPELKFRLYKNILENHESHIKFDTFTMTDNEHVPITTTKAYSITKLTHSKNLRIKNLFDSHLYMYLKTLPELTKIKNLKKKIIKQLKGSAKHSKESAYYLFRIAFESKSYTNSKKWQKQTDPSFITAFDKLALKTHWFKSPDSETLLLKTLQVETLDTETKQKCTAELIEILLRKKEMERADYYFELLDERLIAPYRYYKLKQRTQNTSIPKHIYQTEMANFPYEVAIYKHLFQKSAKKKIPLKILKKLLKNAPNSYSKLHMNYILYHYYKRLPYSRQRNRKMSFYSKQCYLLLKDLCRYDILFK